MSANEKQYQIKKADAYLKRDIRLNGLGGFFVPFNSLSDVRQEIRSTLLIPIVNLTLGLGTALFSLSKLAETAVNLVVIDLDHAANSNTAFLSALETSFCFAGSLLVDTLWSLMSLAVRTLSTVVAGIAAIAYGVADLGRAVINCASCNSEPKASF